MNWMEGPPWRFVHVTEGVTLVKERMNKKKLMNKLSWLKWSAKNMIICIFLRDAKFNTEHAMMKTIYIYIYAGTRWLPFQELQGSQLPNWKSTFLICPCHEIYSVEAIGLSLSNFPGQFLDCFCIFLKNYNTLVTSKICFLLVTFQGT